MMLPDKIRIGAYQRTVLFPGSGQVFVPEADTIEVDIREQVPLASNFVWSRTVRVSEKKSGNTSIAKRDSEDCKEQGNRHWRK